MFLPELSRLPCKRRSPSQQNSSLKFCLSHKMPRRLLKLLKWKNSQVISTTKNTGQSLSTQTMSMLSGLDTTCRVMLMRPLVSTTSTFSWTTSIAGISPPFDKDLTLNYGIFSFWLPELTLTRPGTIASYSNTIWEISMPESGVLSKILAISICLSYLTCYRTLSTLDLRLRTWLQLTSLTTPKISFNPWALFSDLSSISTLTLLWAALKMQSLPPKNSWALPKIRPYQSFLQRSVKLWCKKRFQLRGHALKTSKKRLEITIRNIQVRSSSSHQRKPLSTSSSREILNFRQVKATNGPAKITSNLLSPLLLDPFTPYLASQMAPNAHPMPLHSVLMSSKVSSSKTVPMIKRLVSSMLLWLTTLQEATWMKSECSANSHSHPRSTPTIGSPCSQLMKTRTSITLSQLSLSILLTMLDSCGSTPSTINITHRWLYPTMTGPSLLVTC